MSGPAKHVLCVDDSPQICEAVSSILRMAEVHSAFDIARALALAGGSRFELFIIDYFLPDGTGPELLAKLRVICPDTPAVLMTTCGHLTDEEAKRLGAAGLIVKAGGTFVKDLTEIAEGILQTKAAATS